MNCKGNITLTQEVLCLLHGGKKKNNHFPFNKKSKTFFFYLQTCKTYTESTVSFNQNVSFGEGPLKEESDDR